jgi:lipopolysaccharide/colanic/teichoic acid biosynthesis glycosyltransferase
MGMGSSVMTQPVMNSSDGNSAPLEPAIESLPFVGRTWYTRGPSYWFRRALFTLFFLALAALNMAFLMAVALTVKDRIGGEVLLVLAVVVGLASGIWLWRHIPPADSKAPSRRATVSGAGTGAAAGTLARAVGGVFAGAFLLVAAILTVGPLVVVVLKSLTPVMYQERKARERLEPWFRAQGRVAPWHTA